MFATIEPRVLVVFDDSEIGLNAVVIIVKRVPVTGRIGVSFVRGQRGCRTGILWVDNEAAVRSTTITSRDGNSSILSLR